MKLYKKDQHFLIDKLALDRIIEYGKLHVSDTVLEIGAGYGNLTERIAGKAGRVIAIEADPELAASLYRLKNVEVIVGDAMKVDFPEFNKVISNLPYSISSPVTFKLLSSRFEFGILMYQYDFAKRMVAAPGGKDYGRLSITVQYYADVEILEVLPPASFSPAPEVKSAIVNLVPRPPPFTVKDEDFFMKFIKAVFSQRRKKLRNAILNNANFLGISDSAILKLPEELLVKRAEILSPQELANIADTLFEEKFKHL